MLSTRGTSSISLLIASALAACVACSSPEATAPSEIDFWDALAVDAMEVDPPEDLAGLVSRSPTIVVGEIVDVEEVPAQVSGLPEDVAVVALEIEVSEVVVAGDLGDQHTIGVVRPREAAISVRELRANLPASGTDIVFFLKPAEYGGYYATTSDLGAIGLNDSGSLVTVFDPNLSPNVIPPGTQSLADLQRLL